MDRIDQLDMDIMRILQEDGRKSFKDIGSILDKPESTIRSRYNNLIEKKVLRIVAIANPHDIGLNIMGLLFLKVDLQSFEKTARTIGEFPEVRFIAYTTGVYDLVVEIYVKNYEELIDFMTKKLSEITGIRGYDLSLELKLLKDSYQWLDRDDLL